MHCHRNSVDEGNEFFGPGDIVAGQSASNIRGSVINDYLGGSDGSVKVIRDPTHYPAGFDGTLVPHNDYINISPSHYFRGFEGN